MKKAISLDGIRGIRNKDWNGICVVCGHDYIHNCQGNCTCLSCNAQRQDDEAWAKEHNYRVVEQEAQQ